MTAQPIGGGVSLVSLAGSEFGATFYLTSGMTSADEGKPVKMGAADNTVALAGDGDVIIGVLDKVEDRVNEGILVGTVCLRGIRTFNYASGDAVALGEKIVGAGSGEVKRVASPTVFNTTLVVAKRATGGKTVREIDVIFKTI
jgi:hypothetical protein